MKRVRVLISLITANNDCQRGQPAAADEAARRLDSIAVVYADNDAVKQTQQVLKAIPDGNHPNAVLVEPVGTGMTQIAAAAAAARQVGEL
jgi:plasmid stabilization system protein ParE